MRLLPFWKSNNPRSMIDIVEKGAILAPFFVAYLTEMRVLGLGRLVLNVGFNVDGVCKSRPEGSLPTDIQRQKGRIRLRGDSRQHGLE